ncbi:hypothetical protein V8E53_013236, partial [Lactarius tabidus]
IRAGNDFRPPIRAPTRGAIFEDAQLYENYARWSVGAYLLVRRSVFVLDPVKEVPLSPRKLCQARPISVQPLLHSLDLWYYPPLVRDIVMDLESTARGYAERMDVLNPMKMFKRSLDKIENGRNDEATRRVKKTKTNVATLAKQPNHRELMRLADTAPAPDWLPKSHEIWLEAMNHVTHLNLAPAESPRRFLLPPVHLFWGCNEQKQRTYFYHFFVLHYEFGDRAMRKLPPLTTQEWRSILGDTYWKQQWPKDDGNIPQLESTYDPNAFWKHGGPLFFGDERSAKIAAGKYGPRSTRPCGCAVRMDSADDPDVRQAALYQLISMHSKWEMEEMECLLFPEGQPEEGSARRRWGERLWGKVKVLNMWTSTIWRPSDIVTEFCTCQSWRLWVSFVQDIVAEWDGFDSWDWEGHPPPIRAHNSSLLDYSQLDTQNFRRLTIRLLAFFIHTFVTRLSYYPSPLLLYPPTLKFHTCVEHGYRAVSFDYP